MNYFKLDVNERVNITNFHDFSKTFVISMTFPGLEITILKFHDFSRFSMTVRTLALRLNPLSRGGGGGIKAVYLLDVSFGEGKLGGQVEHNLPPSEYSVDGFRPGLSVGDVQPAAEPAT